MMMTIPVEYLSPLKKPSMVKKHLTEKELNTNLTKIFTKIGCLDKAGEGIRELHQLLLDHPECDVKVNMFLSSAGTFFQKYIRNALAEITTNEMRKCGMLPNDPIITQPTISVPVAMKISIPKSQNLESNSKSLQNSSATPPLTPMTKAFTERFSKETFEQTRSRLHSIFQYEEYKSGQKRSSLPNLDMLANDTERLEYVKNIIRSSKSRRSSWMHSYPNIMGPSQKSRPVSISKRKIEPVSS
ncbi:hypothetical protein G9A89_018597 [Geosiphon pyriformis]|nr:hypothetical protein G9A89_018597 [Geosiphon pyriformis]